PPRSSTSPTKSANSSSRASRSAAFAMPPPRTARASCARPPSRWCSAAKQRSRRSTVSLSWRDRVEVGLYPDRLVLARGKAAQTFPVPPGDAQAPRWRAALDALGALEALRRTEVTVVLSSFFVRYTVVPLSEALSGAVERLAFARHCLARIHGPLAEGWTVRLSREIACGVEPLLVQGLRETLSAR